jgi:hypothetical protein
MNGVRVTPQEQQQITKWNAKLACETRIDLLETQDKRSPKLGRFCDDLARLAPAIDVAKVKGDPKKLPAIRLGHGMYYHAVPLGSELEPFLEALGSTKQTGAVPALGGIENANAKQPAELRLYVSQQCPFCPGIVRQLIPIVSENESIRLAIIDSDLFPEVAHSDRIRAVPTLLLDEKFRWTGSVPLEELMESISSNDPGKLGAGSLKRMLKEGNATQLAKMMLDRETIFAPFLDLLTDEKWPTRLGAMVALEEIAARNPELASQVIDPLWDRFHRMQDTVKGDIIYLLGESGGHDIVPRLEMVLRGHYDSEIKEAAREALQKIRTV